MRRLRHTKKGLAAFVLLFLCLNVGGALCLTACTQLFAADEMASASDSHLSEHCKQARKAVEERERDSTKIEAGDGSCCMMPVAMFAAPVEKRQEVNVVPVLAVLPAAVQVEFTAPILNAASLPATPVYRPPPLDRRGERVLHSVFRI